MSFSYYFGNKTKGFQIVIARKPRQRLTRQSQTFPPPRDCHGRFAPSQ